MRHQARNRPEGTVVRTVVTLTFLVLALPKQSFGQG